ncbi:reverse transcriptase [Phytophthora megakarya]|uniref:Reverse transcriptase n=1 Tax=Phytophthora megakarya TaxID=4795 RepID=A0A225V3L0_9STRA|nr:reverse transcriptase [Phytophthora megakarya]
MKISKVDTKGSLGRTRSCVPNSTGPAYCASGKGAPPNAGPSPGNIEPRYPFEAVSMDFVTHTPESARGNTFLLLFQDMFSGYVMCKPMSSTTAQDVAEAYEEQVFQRFGSGRPL